MKITSLYAVNFRNYSSCSLSLPAMVNVFYGRNAQGKTNFLEAVFYGAFGLSHRTAAEDELLRLGCGEMAVGLRYESFSGGHEIKIKKTVPPPAAGARAKKEIFLDGVKIRPREHYGAFNAVMFSPEDLQLVKGEPALRRRFLDMQIAQTDPVYYDLLLKYNRALSQRNRLLKEVREGAASPALLDTWDRELALLAASLTAKRLQAAALLQQIASMVYGAIAGRAEKFSVCCELKGNDGAVLCPEPEEAAAFDAAYYQRLLAERRRPDILRGSTGIGPHRDDLRLLLDGLPLKAFGSQGQQRSAALALKLSQLEYVRRETGEFPVLLLDDVLSELDGSRRACLLSFIDGRVQTFITVNDRELVPQLPECAYFEVSGGTVTEA